MKHLTIKARIMLLCTLLAAAAAALALAVVVHNEQGVVEAYFSDSLAATVQLARDDIRSENGELEIDRNLDDLPNVRVAIYNLDGDLIYGQQRFESPFQPGDMHRVKGAGSARWMVQDTRLDFDDASGIWLRCYISADAVESMRGSLSDILIVLFPVLVLLAAIGGWGIASRAFRPVVRIIQTAESIADGADLKKRIGLHTGAQDEIYRTAQVFDAMLNRLDDAFERERRFTSDASHELRTPATAIGMQAELALEPGAGEQDRIEALQEIQRQSGRMSALIQRLLVLARLDARQVLNDMEDVDLALLAEITAESMQDRAAARGMRIAYECAGSPVVRGDHTMLTQALLNLVENAVNYGNEGGNIRISAACSAGTCTLSVSDDGPGIPAEVQTHIFDRFYRADASRHSGGFGLGLSLVKRIMQLHGGNIRLESVPGEGSCFTMFFPLTHEKEDANA